MIMTSKLTVGKIASDLINKRTDPVFVIDQMRENLTDYEKNVYEAALKGIKDFTGNFYVIVLNKTERLMQNVNRNYYFCRSTCPTPNYDQTVYRYDRKDNDLRFLWVIPCRDAAFYLRDNAFMIAPDEQDILKYVLAFDNGTLFKTAKKLNGEKIESSFLDN